MTSDRERSARRFGAALSIAVLFFVACTAAFVAHHAIDAVGDWLLPHDAYDGVTHDSRTIAFAAALSLAIVAAIATARAALAEVRGDAGALRDLLLASLPHRPLPFVTATTLVTIPLLGAMGVLDDAIAGREIAFGDVASFDALFGGSFALGAGVATLCAFVLGGLCATFVRALAGAHLTLVRALASFVRARREVAPARGLGRRRRFATRAVAALLAKRAAGRAPPRMLAA